MVKIILSCAVIFAFAFANAAERNVAVSSLPWSDETLFDMIGDLASIDAVEIAVFEGMTVGTGVFPNARFSQKMSPDEMASAKKILDSCGVKIVCYICAQSDDEEFIKKTFELAKMFGIRAIAVMTKNSDLRLYDKYSAETKIQVGIFAGIGASEHVAHREPNKLADTVRRFKFVSAYPDCADWEISGINIVETAKSLGGKICAVNISDVDWGGRRVSCGSGKLPMAALLDELDSQGFDGYYIVAFDKMSLPMSKIAPSVAFLKSRPKKVKAKQK